MYSKMVIRDHNSGMYMGYRIQPRNNDALVAHIYFIIFTEHLNERNLGESNGTDKILYRMWRTKSSCSA